MITLNCRRGIDLYWSVFQVFYYLTSTLLHTDFAIWGFIVISLLKTCRNWFQLVVLWQWFCGLFSYNLFADMNYNWRMIQRHIDAWHSIIIALRNPVSDTEIKKTRQPVWIGKPVGWFTTWYESNNYYLESISEAMALQLLSIWNSTRSAQCFEEVIQKVYFVFWETCRLKMWFFINCPLLGA